MTGPGATDEAAFSVEGLPVESGARERLSLPGIAMAVVGFLLAGQPSGLLAIGLLALAWYVTSPVAVGTLGAFLLAGVASASGPVALAIVAVGLALTVLGPTARSGAPGVALLGTAGLALLLGVGVALLTSAQSIPIAAGTLAVAVAVLGYALHRYALVAIERLRDDGGDRP